MTIGRLGVEMACSEFARWIAYDQHEAAEREKAEKAAAKASGVSDPDDEDED